MKTFKQYNESVKDLLKGKSEEEIQKLLKGLNAFDKIDKIKELDLPDKFWPSNEEYKKDFDEKYNSLDGNWEKGSFNTIILQIPDPYFKTYIPKCKNCNEVTELKNCFEDRQMIGNVYQSLCNCGKCGKYIILDEDDYDSHKRYLEDKKLNENFKDLLKPKSKDEIEKSIMNSITNDIGIYHLSKIIEYSIDLELTSTLQKILDLKKTFNLMSEKNKLIKKATNIANKKIVELLRQIFKKGLRSSSIKQIIDDTIFYFYAIQGKNDEAKECYDDNITEKTKKNVFNRICQMGNLDMAKFLIGKGVLILTDAFAYACGSGNMKLVKLLIDNGADVEAGKNGGLNFAILRNKPEMVQFLLSKFATPNSVMLNTALKNNNYEIIQILKNHGYEV